MMCCVVLIPGIYEVVMEQWLQTKMIFEWDSEFECDSEFGPRWACQPLSDYEAQYTQLIMRKAVSYSSPRFNSTHVCA